MAVDKKISELNAIVSPDAADVFPIVDVSAVETKKITFSDLVAAIFAGTSLDITTEIVTTGLAQVGDNVTITLATALSQTYTALQFISRNGQIIMPNGSALLPGSSWSIALGVVTVYNADVSDIFLVQYIHA